MSIFTQFTLESTICLTFISSFHSSEVKLSVSCFAVNNLFKLYFSVVLSMVALVVAMATIHEGWRTYKGLVFDSETDHLSVSFLHCFSILENGRKILSFKAKVLSCDNLSCLNGIRFLSTCWVIIGHTIYSVAFVNSANRNDLIDVH